MLDEAWHGIRHVARSVDSRSAATIGATRGAIRAIIKGTSRRTSGRRIPSSFRPLATACRQLHRSASTTRLDRFTHHPLPSHSRRTTFSHTATLLRTITNGTRAPLRSHIFLTRAVPFPGVLIGLSASRSIRIHGTITNGTGSGG